MRPLCYSTGNIWRQMKKLDIYDVIKQLDIDGVEVVLGSNLHERVVPAKHHKWLRKLKHNSLHLSSHMLRNARGGGLLEDLRWFEDTYKKIGAKYALIHPGLEPDKKILSKFKMNYLTENMDARKINRRTSFEKVLNERKDFDLCLDVSHAYAWGPKETGRIIKKWRERIKQVHFSNNFMRLRHMPFTKTTPRFLRSIEPMKELDVPIVIEEDMKYKTVPQIRRELDRIRKILAL